MSVGVVDVMWAEITRDPKILAMHQQIAKDKATLPALAAYLKEWYGTMFVVSTYGDEDYYTRHDVMEERDLRQGLVNSLLSMTHRMMDWDLLASRILDTIPKTIVIPDDMIETSTHFTADGIYLERSGVTPTDYRTKAILMVEGREFEVAGYSIGIVPEGYGARKETGGPIVPGPWASVYGNCAVIDNNGGTAAEHRAAAAVGRLFKARLGDRLQFHGHTFELKRRYRSDVALEKVD